MSFRPAVHNLTIHQGQTERFEFRQAGEDQPWFTLTNGARTFRFRSQTRLNYDAAGVLADLNEDNGGVEVTINDEEKKFALIYPAELTASFPRARPVYDVEAVENGTGVVYRLVMGEIEVSPEATK